MISLKGEQKVVCNRCGKPLNVWDIQEDFVIRKQQLGYGTKYDGEGLRIQFCCDCMESLIGECLVSPLIDNT